MTRTRTKQLTSGIAWRLLALGLAGFCRAGQPSESEQAGALMRRAAEAEQSCRTNDAIAAYTLLLQRAPSFEPVVGPRLVSLYIGGGQEALALSWAARVSRRQPAPKAYLAGVHAQLGQFKEAELLLRQTIQETQAPQARLTLKWQLADALEKAGDRDAAVMALEDAQSDASGESEKAAAAQRLESLRGRAAAKPAAAPAVAQHTKGRNGP